MPPVLRSDDIYTECFGGGGKVVVCQGMSKAALHMYDDESTVTKQTAENVICSNLESCREVSTIEFMYTSTRHLNLSWSSQAVIYLHIGDPRKVKYTSSFSVFICSM